MDINIDNHINPESKLPSLPLISMRMVHDPSLEKVEWYGRGPNENYSDRKTGAAIGRYVSTVDKQYFPYIMPQATGSKQDVCWTALRDGNDDGLMFASGAGPFSFSALHYSQDDLAKAKHTYELKRRDEVFLNIYARERGIGNASCGPAILTKYEIKTDPVTFTYSIRPVNANADLDKTGREKLPVVSMSLITRDVFAVFNIKTPSPDDKVYYTLDSSEPTANSSRFTLPFEVVNKTTIKAKVINDNLESKTASYQTKELKMFKPEIIPGDVCFVDSILVEMNSIIGKAQIYYTLDGTTPDKSLTLYTKPVWIKNDSELKAVAYREGFYREKLQFQNTKR